MSKFFYLKNLSSRDLDELPDAPWTCNANYPKFSHKEDFRKWCVAPATDHAFITLVEPVNPKVRCSDPNDPNSGNPPKKMHGFIADFDSPKLVGRPTAELISEVLLASNMRQAAQPPNWICRTWSGKARLIWLFETPVPVDSKPHQIGFVKALMEHLQVDRLLVGGRDETSDKPDQLFEIGFDWQPIFPDVIPKELTTTWFFESSKKAIVATTSRVTIPLEDIAVEVEKQFPGRWQGSFEFGSRGPLFWIPDGIDRVGCQVGDHGMICYSDRADSAFLPWSDVLGKNFVAKYESKCIHEATGNIYYDGGRYHEYEEESNKVTTISKDDLCLRFRVAGFSDSNTKKSTSSEIDNLRHFINTEHRVTGAVPLVHFRPGPVFIEGQTFFNLRCKKVVQPAEDGDPSKWPFLYKFFTNIFDQEEQEGFGPHIYFFAWLKRFYEGAYKYIPNQGHGIILTGEAGQGKTFLASRVLADLMGGCEDASHILTGKTSFSGNLAGSPVWAIDDTTNAPDHHHRRMFGELLKQQIANPFVDYHPKYSDAQRVSWHGRIVITCNSDSASLDVIPNLEESILDKLHLFKTSKYRHKFGSNEENAATLARELPHMARWLLDWTPPAEIYEGPRFGAKPYHHSFVRKVAAEASAEYMLTELLEMWIKSYRANFGTEDKWEGTATELYGELQLEPRLKELSRSWNSQRIGKALAKLRDIYKPYLEFKSKGGRSTHVFDTTYYEKT